MGLIFACSSTNINDKHNWIADLHDFGPVTLSVHGFFVSSLGLCLLHPCVWSPLPDSDPQLCDVGFNLRDEAGGPEEYDDYATFEVSAPPSAGHQTLAAGRRRR